MCDSGVVIGRLGPLGPVRSASATFVGRGLEIAHLVVKMKCSKGSEMVEI